jgi:hypothetical protein
MLPNILYYEPGTHSMRPRIMNMRLPYPTSIVSMKLESAGKIWTLYLQHRMWGRSKIKNPRTQIKNIADGSSKGEDDG